MVQHIANFAASERHTIPTALRTAAAASLDQGAAGFLLLPGAEFREGHGHVSPKTADVAGVRPCCACRGSICWPEKLVAIFFTISNISFLGNWPLEDSIGE